MNEQQAAVAMAAAHIYAALITSPRVIEVDGVGVVDMTAEGRALMRTHAVREAKALLAEVARQQAPLGAGREE